MKFISLFIVVIVLVGCSKRGVYEGIQTGNRNQCLKVPQSEYDECIKDASKPYDEYERERKEAIEY